jgi:DNA protecting protein DprA
MAHPVFDSLHAFKQSPSRIWTRGDSKVLDRLPASGLAVVGTRNPSRRSEEFVRHVISALRGTNVVIVSGFARGIDSVAHRSALHAGLSTVAVLGAGLDINYPGEHEDLRRRITESGGLLLTEFPPGCPALPNHFLRRNRLIAALSRAVWIAQAGIRSGALNTSRWARDFGITTLATPCFPGEPGYEGNQKLIDDHQATPVWGVHSLGVQWLDLATRSAKGNSDWEFVGTEIDRLEKSGAPATFLALMDWALRAQWSHERLLAAIQTGLSIKKLTEKNGCIEFNP